MQSPELSCMYYVHDHFGHQTTYPRTLLRLIERFRNRIRLRKVSVPLVQKGTVQYKKLRLLNDIGRKGKENTLFLRERKNPSYRAFFLVPRIH